jgi:hypothetical protein
MLAAFQLDVLFICLCQETVRGKQIFPYLLDFSKKDLPAHEKAASGKGSGFLAGARSFFKNDTGK